MRAWIEERQSGKSKRYFVLWRVVDGNTPDGKKKYKKKSIAAGSVWGTAIDIRNKIDERLVRENAGLTDNEMTINVAIDKYLEHSATWKRPNTVRLIKYALVCIRKAHGTQPVVSISTAMLQNLIDELMTHYKQNGVNIRIVAIKAFFMYAQTRGIIKESPASGGKLKKFKYKKVARYLTKEEIDKLLVAASSTPSLPEMIKIGVWTGMRVGEVYTLTAEQIKVQDGKIRIYLGSGQSIGYNTTKTDEGRFIKVVKEIEEVFASLPKSGRLFPDWHHNRIEQAFKRAVDRADIGRVRFHDLRHTFCSNYLQSGGNTAALMKITGHEDLKSLQKYTHFQNGYQDSLMDNMTLH